MSLETIFYTAFIIFGCVMVLPVATILGYRVVHEALRRKAMRAIAAEHGYEFKDVVIGKMGELEAFRLFKGVGTLASNARQRIRNVLISRSDDLVVTVLDYQCKGCDAGEDFDPLERRTLVHVTAPQFDLPAFDVRPNGLFLKLTSKFRSKVKTDVHPAFAKRYDLSCEEQDRVRDLLHADVLGLIASEPREFRFEGNGNGLLFFPVGQDFFGEGRIKPDDLPQILEFATQLGQRILQSSAVEHGATCAQEPCAVVV